MTFRRLTIATAVTVLCGFAGVGCSSSVTGALLDLIPDASAPTDSGNQEDSAVDDAGLSLGDSGDDDVDAGDAARVDAGQVDATPPLTDGSVPVDASNDAGAKDTGAPIDASDADATLTCSPVDVSAFVPTWHDTAVARACTQAQIDAYHQCLNDSESQASPPSCAPFTGPDVSESNLACVACIVMPDTAPAYGPIILHTGTLEMNVPGCLSLATSDPHGTGCSGKLQASSECTNAACSANCPVTDDASFQAEQQCEAAASTGGCASWTAAATCVNSLVDAGGAAAACVSGQSFDELFDAIVPVFCGGAVVDAGSPARAPSPTHSARALSRH